MNTFFTEDPIKAAAIVSSGKLVVFPTETVYGLGGNALDPKAVEKIYQAKGRPASNPLIVHLGPRTDVASVAAEVTPAARILMESFFPGPLTLILPRHASLPKIVTAGLETVAIRMPSLPLSIEFLNTARIPVAAPSANLSGRPSATTWQSAAEDLNHRVHCILRGPAATVGLESTVVDCTDSPTSVLRPGAISLESLQSVLPDISSASLNMHRSPGMQFHHYAPAAHVQLIHSPTEISSGDCLGYIGLDAPAADLEILRCLIVNSIEDYSHQLFEFFRDCDRAKVTTIYCQKVPNKGLGRALLDRLIRSAKSPR